MRKSSEDLVLKYHALSPLVEPIVDIGGLHYEKMWDQYFNSKILDIQTNSEIVADVMNMPQIESDSIQTIITLDTFEHIENPYKAIDEIYRVMKKDGLLILTTLLIWDFHEYPAGTGDYWRFTVPCLEKLCHKFEKIESGWEKETVPIDDSFIESTKSGVYFVGRK